MGRIGSMGIGSGTARNRFASFRAPAEKMSGTLWLVSPIRLRQRFVYVGFSDRRGLIDLHRVQRSLCSRCCGDGRRGPRDGRSPDAKLLARTDLTCLDCTNTDKFVADADNTVSWADKSGPATKNVICGATVVRRGELRHCIAELKRVL